MIKKVVSTEKRPIKLWLDDIEDGALEQAKDIANLPFTFKHVPIMPDSHQGYGMPIGSILATQGVIVPNAVGVDIGCGMAVHKLNLKSISNSDLASIGDLIKEKIPVGFNGHKEAQDKFWLPEWDSESIVAENLNKARHQVGTLGGGNHFIEIQEGDDGNVWIMIHSGSRNLGHTVAGHYHKTAVNLNKDFYSSVPSDLAFLPLSSDEGKNYFREMDYCVRFAAMNRMHMMAAVRSIVKHVTGHTALPFDTLDKSHNFARIVLVHRKGACSALEDEYGMIPSSQGSKSYIVKGLGNTESFKSSSHGAGRKMGRKAAKRELDLSVEQAKIIASGSTTVLTEAGLDEAVGAYKDMNKVMSNQDDLVKIEVELSPLLTIKG